MSSSLPTSLRKAAAEKKVIPFVGAGVSMAVRLHDGRPAFPSWRGLLELAADMLEGEGRDAHTVVRAMLGLSEPNYLDAARYAREGLGSLWTRFLDQAFNVRRRDVDDASLEVARKVWGLGSPLVVTTNYDRALAWVCPDPDELDDIQIEAPAGLINILRGNIDRPTVWHLHGSVKDPSKIVLSPDGYELLYASDSQKAVYHAALTSLRSIMGSHTILFVGFSLNDPFVRRQLEWVYDVFKGCAGPHYLLARTQDVAATRAELKDLPVEVIAYKDHGAPLIERLSEIGFLSSMRGSVVGSSPYSASTEPASPPAADLGVELSDESSALLRDRPEGYEHLFLFQQLQESVDQQRRARDRLRYGIVGSVRTITAEELSSVTKPITAELRGVMRSGMGVINAINQAMGEPGQPADLLAIIHLAGEYGDLYRRTLQAAIEASSLESEDEIISKLLELFSRFASSLIDEFEAYPPRAKAHITSLLSKKDSVGDEPVAFRFTLRPPDGWEEEFDHYMEIALSRTG